MQKQTEQQNWNLIFEILILISGVAIVFRLLGIYLCNVVSVIDTPSQDIHKSAEEDYSEEN